MSLIKARHVINDTHTPHFAADDFEHPGAEPIFFTKRRQGNQEFTFRVFELDKYMKKYLLMIPVVWK